MKRIDIYKLSATADQYNLKLVVPVDPHDTPSTQPAVFGINLETREIWLVPLILVHELQPTEEQLHLMFERHGYNFPKCTRLLGHLCGSKQYAVGLEIGWHFPRVPAQNIFDHIHKSVSCDGLKGVAFMMEMTAKYEEVKWAIEDARRLAIISDCKVNTDRLPDQWGMSPEASEQEKRAYKANKELRLRKLNHALDQTNQ